MESNDNIRKAFWLDHDYFIWLSTLPEYNQYCTEYVEKIKSKNITSKQFNVKQLLSQTKANLKSLPNAVLHDFNISPKTIKVSSPIYLKIENSLPLTIINQIIESTLKHLLYRSLGIEIKLEHYNLSRFNENIKREFRKAINKKDLESYSIISLLSLNLKNEDIESWITYCNNNKLKLGFDIMERIKSYKLNINEYLYDFKIENEKFYLDADLLVNGNELIEIRWNSSPMNYSHLLNSATILKTIDKITIIDLLSGEITKIDINNLMSGEITKIDINTSNEVLNLYKISEVKPFDEYYEENQDLCSSIIIGTATAFACIIGIVIQNIDKII